jgi:HEPN domain-containing protein
MSEPTKQPEKTPREWLRYAQGDLDVAEREMAYTSPSYHTVCFLCQSAAEKFLKGYLIAQSWPLKKIHDLVDLLGDCTHYDQTFDDLIPDGVVLNEYITSGRYPGDVALEAIGSDEAQQAVQSARRIRDAVLAQLSTNTEQEG